MLYNILLSTPSTLRVIDTADSVSEAWRKAQHHAKDRVMNSDLGLRVRPDGYSIFSEVGESLGKITWELKHVGQTGDGWNY